MRAVRKLRENILCRGTNRRHPSGVLIKSLSTSVHRVSHPKPVNCACNPAQKGVSHNNYGDGKENMGICVPYDVYDIQKFWNKKWNSTKYMIIGSICGGSGKKNVQIFFIVSLGDVLLHLSTVRLVLATLALTSD